MIIFNKKTRETAKGKEFSIRQFGADFWETAVEFEKQVALGNVFFKANKPVFTNDISKY